MRIKLHEVKLFPTLFLATVLLLMVPPALAAVGRVLIAVGDVAAVRNAVRIPLVDGASVEAGDNLQVGERSHLQLRMDDGAVISLRANTILSIDAYNASNQASENRSVLNLVKGGLRTVTGLIAQTNRAGYAVRTATSTIGVRGTHFTLVQCAGDCTAGAGARAADGLYGGVSDGRVGVTNDAGDREFGRNQYFYVAAANTPAVQIPAPPPFLRDPLDARARAKDKKPDAAQVAAEAVVAGEATSSADASSANAATTSDPATTVSGAAVAAPPALETRPPVNQPVIQGVAYNSGEAFVRPGPNNLVSATINEGFGTPSGIEMNGVIVPGREYRLGAFTWTQTTLDQDSTGQPASFQTTLMKEAATVVGSDATAGDLIWGQYLLRQDSIWLDGADKGTTFSSLNIARHFVVGDGPTALPTSGNYTYNWIGGTSPSDRSGVSGSMSSGGQIGVDFQFQNMSTLSPIRFIGPSGIAYSIAFSNVNWTPTIESGSDPAAGTRYTQTRFPAIDVTSTSACTGCASLLNATIAPGFLGQSAESLGLGVGTQANTVTGARESIGSVQVYKR